MNDIDVAEEAVAAAKAQQQAQAQLDDAAARLAAARAHRDHLRSMRPLDARGVREWLDANREPANVCGLEPRPLGG